MLLYEDEIKKKIKKLSDLERKEVLDFADYLSNKSGKPGISENEIKKPNKKTLKAMEDVEKRRNLVKCKDAKDMFKKLGI